MGRTTLIEHDVPVEMRDGTVLRADVWRPAEGPASPAVLFRTPYGKSPLGLATLTPAQCVDRGYAAVVQDTRGRFGSEGEWAPLDWSQEGPDGYDTVEWTAEQPWCDGNVAMAGTSYQAIVQWLAAMEKPPHLRAIAPTMSTSAPFDAEQLGGFLRLDHLTSWLGLTALEWVQRRAAAGDPVDGAVVAEVVQLLTAPEVPLRRWPLSTILDFEGFPGRLRDIFAGHVATVADYRLGEVGVPTFSVGGWYDVFSHGTIELHRAVRALDPVAGRHELVVGPWVHSGQLPQVQGEVNTGPYGSAQGARLADLHLDFFDRHLRPAGGTTGRDSGGDVRYFLFGDDAWHRAASWPPPEAVDAPWYLAGPADGEEGGRLLPAPPREAPGHDAFTYDPEDPVPSHGGGCSSSAGWRRARSTRRIWRTGRTCSATPPSRSPSRWTPSAGSGCGSASARTHPPPPWSPNSPTYTRTGVRCSWPRPASGWRPRGTARGTSRTTPICCSGTPRGASPPGTGCGSTSPAATSPIWTGTPTSRARSARRSTAAPPVSRSGTAARTRACCG